jgi:hypothetical protein
VLEAGIEDGDLGGAIAEWCDAAVVEDGGHGGIQRYERRGTSDERKATAGGRWEPEF